MAISALLDGELPQTEIAAVEEHVDRCADCRGWQESAHELTRRIRLGSAEAPARPSAAARARIHAAAGPNWRRREVGVLRVLLVGVALAQLAITIPLLIFGRYDATRDLGATDMALAVAFLIVGRQPGRARAVGPVIGTAAGLLMLTAVLAVVRDGDGIASEAPHLIALVGWLLVQRLGRVTPPSVENPEATWSRGARDAARRIAHGPSSIRGEQLRRPGGHGLAPASHPDIAPAVVRPTEREERRAAG